METSQSIWGLWRAFRGSGDLEARDRLVAHYAPLVRYVARRVGAGLPNGFDLDDLVSDGVLGLMGAMNHFDLERGLRFQTFAQPRIRGAIIDGLRASDWVPRLVREQLRDLGNATAALERRLQRHPRDDEVAAELGISVHELARRSSQGAHAALSSLEGEPGEDAVITRPTHDLDRMGGGLPDGFLGALHGLPERDRIILALYYWERMSLAQIGQVLCVSESRVCQLMRRATQELRERVA